MDNKRFKGKHTHWKRIKLIPYTERSIPMKIADYYKK